MSSVQVNLFRCSVLGFQKVVFVNLCQHFCPVPNFQFLSKNFEMPVNGTFLDSDETGNFPVRFALRHPISNLMLAPGELKTGRITCCS